MKVWVSDQRYANQSFVCIMHLSHPIPKFLNVIKISWFLKLRCFSEFLQSRYHRGWWHRLLSPGQEDTLSRVNNSSITFHFYVLALHVHQRFLPFAGNLDTGDQACGISARDLWSNYDYLMNLCATWYLFLKPAIYETGSVYV